MLKKNIYVLALVPLYLILFFPICNGFVLREVNWNYMFCEFPSLCISGLLCFSDNVHTI